MIAIIPFVNGCVTASNNSPITTLLDNALTAGELPIDEGKSFLAGNTILATLQQSNPSLSELLHVEGLPDLLTITKSGETYRLDMKYHSSEIEYIMVGSPASGWLINPIEQKEPKPEPEQVNLKEPGKTKFRKQIGNDTKATINEDESNWNDVAHRLTGDKNNGGRIARLNGFDENLPPPAGAAISVPGYMISAGHK